jgi:hypothetical protein
MNSEEFHVASSNKENKEVKAGRNLVKKRNKEKAKKEGSRRKKSKRKSHL